MNTGLVAQIARIDGALEIVIAIAVRTADLVGIAPSDRQKQALTGGGVAQVGGAHVAVVAVGVDRAVDRRGAAGQVLVNTLAVERVANVQRARIAVIALDIGGAPRAAVGDLRVLAGSKRRDAIVGGTRLAI